MENVRIAKEGKVSPDDKISEIFTKNALLHPLKPRIGFPMPRRSRKLIKALKDMAAQSIDPVDLYYYVEDDIERSIEYSNRLKYSHSKAKYTEESKRRDEIYAKAIRENLAHVMNMYKDICDGKDIQPELPSAEELVFWAGV